MNNNIKMFLPALLIALVQGCASTSLQDLIDKNPLMPINLKSGKQERTYPAPRSKTEPTTQRGTRTPNPVHESIKPTEDVIKDSPLQFSMPLPHTRIQLRHYPAIPYQENSPKQHIPMAQLTPNDKHQIENPLAPAMKAYKNFQYDHAYRLATRLIRNHPLKPNQRAQAAILAAAAAHAHGHQNTTRYWLRYAARTAPNQPPNPRTYTNELINIYQQESKR